MMKRKKMYKMLSEINKCIRNMYPYLDEQEYKDILKYIIKNNVLNENDHSGELYANGDNWQTYVKPITQRPLTDEELEALKTYAGYTRPENLTPPTPEEMEYIKKYAKSIEDTEYSPDVSSSQYWKRAIQRQPDTYIRPDQIKDMFDFMQSRGLPQTHNFDWSKDPSKITPIPVYYGRDKNGDVLKRFPEIYDYIRTYGLPKEYKDDPWLNLFFDHSTALPTGAVSAYRDYYDSKGATPKGFYNPNDNSIHMPGYASPEEDLNGVINHELGHAYGGENDANIHRFYRQMGSSKGKVSPRKFFKIAAQHLKNYSNDTINPGLEQSQIDMAIKNYKNRLMQIPKTSPEYAQIQQNILTLQQAEPIRIDQIPYRFKNGSRDREYPIYDSEIRRIRDASGPLHNSQHDDEYGSWSHPSIVDTITTAAPVLSRWFDANGIYTKTGRSLADELKLRRVLMRRIQDAALLAKRRRQLAYRDFRDRPSKYTAQDKQVKLPYGSLGGPMSEGVKRYKLKKKVNN
jgi:hypothetical protein